MPGSRVHRGAGAGTCEQDPHLGLTGEDVAARVADGRTNDVPVTASRSVWHIVRGNVFTPINGILGVLFLIILSTGHVLDAAFGLVIVVNSIIGTVQELRAKRTLDRLSIIGQAKPRVRRAGVSSELAPTEVVADDVIEIGPGDQIVVDGQVLTGQALEVDESLLTGESDPVAKTPGSTVMSGSFVVAGTGTYRATRVGRDAYAARLVEEASKFTLVNSELRNGTTRILKFITFLLIPVGALSIYNQLAGHQALPDALRGMVAALLPMLPEGLIVATAFAFAVGVVRLGRRQCLVNELPAIEGLARVDVVCVDKTGTLTESALRLTEVRTVGAADPDVEKALAALAAADPRPNASVAAIKQAYPQDPGWQVEATAAFSSARKWSGASFTAHGTWIFGAPDMLLPAASKAGAEAERIGARGLRVLLLGRTDHLTGIANAPGMVTPVALVVLEQKIRPDAKKTLDYFAGQHVTVKIISGDSAPSTGAVARALELPGADTPIDARTLPEDPQQLAEIAENSNVFGRVTPAQKRALVGALQSKGHTVAMTGDGVNDVLALKDADIGVAMGAGSPAARSVAQIVLLDNKFATLPDVVGEGRRVIGNIERVANLILTEVVYSAVLALLVGISGLIDIGALPYPFLPRHHTIIGLCTVGLPTIILALAPNTERAQSGFVGRVMRMAIPAGLVIAIASFVSYVTAYQGPDATQANVTQASTTALITLITIALWVLGIVARPYTWWKIALIVSMVTLSALMFLMPLTQKVFQLDPSDGKYTQVALACAAVGVVLLELTWQADRWLRSRRTHRRSGGYGL